MWTKKYRKEYMKAYNKKYNTQEFRDEIAKRKKYKQTEEYIAKKLKHKKEYDEWYRRSRGVKPRKKAEPKPVITIAEKRECYATGDYEKALEKLKKRKGIK